LTVEACLTCGNSKRYDEIKDNLRATDKVIIAEPISAMWSAARLKVSSLIGKMTSAESATFSTQIGKGKKLAV
jgi:hypothetical protein